MISAGSKCVLVVEDEDEIRGLIGEILAFEGYQVELAANGQQALIKLKTARPDAIVLDLMMPVMDGWEFLKRCRSDPSYSSRPVLLMSASPALSKTAHDFHVEGFLAKPFELNVLLETVRRLVLLPER
jgi:two-component system, chemotaxis family, chemotaxis protein CheY